MVSCNTLNSVTSIDPQQSFVLGKGIHGRYKAKVKNVGNHPIEVFVQPQNEMAFSLGLLKPGDKTTYSIKANSTVILTNKGSASAEVKLNVKGDTNLSMSYQQ